MKTFVALALTLVLTTACLVGCGCTNQNMDNTSAPTVLPTNEEIWNSTAATTDSSTDATTMTDNSGTTTATDTTDTAGTGEDSSTKSTVRNHVNDYSDMVQEQMKKDKEAKTNSNDRRTTPGA